MVLTLEGDAVDSAALRKLREAGHPFVGMTLPDRYAVPPASSARPTSNDLQIWLGSSLSLAQPSAWAREGPGT